jgi:Iron dependent repressor, N-terminal DNA binding domain
MMAASAGRGSSCCDAARSEAMGKYLWAIYLLSFKAPPVVTSDVAARLGVAPTSVSAMLRRLGSAGLLAASGSGGITLSEHGQRHARDMVRRHRLIETYPVPGPVAKVVAALTAKDPQRRPGDALAVAEWARRVLAGPQVAQAGAGPVITGVSLIPAGPGWGVTRSLRRRLLRSSAAAVLLLLAVWAGWTARHRFGDPPAAVPVIARAGAPGSGLVSVVPSAFYGIRAATAAHRLQALGLRTQVRSVTAPGRPSGTVTGITPAGALSPGTMITFYVAIALPAGPGRPLATTHQRLPGRYPLSARVMMFAVYGCFRDGVARG